MAMQSKLTNLHKTVAIVGAGFSAPAGVPATNHLSENFLNTNFEKSTLSSQIQRVISRNLEIYWQDVFGYESGSQVFPTFEDHFTLLDLAANVGHNLGGRYTPALLRALRRISIHRVFEILNEKYERNATITKLLGSLAAGKDSALVSLNWDTVVEDHIIRLPEYDHRGFTYDIPGVTLDGESQKREGPMFRQLPLIKLHGSANWHYCDSCHATVFGYPRDGKTTITNRTFLEPHDFEQLNGGRDVADEVRSSRDQARPCSVCNSTNPTARVATFSYAKAFDFFPFHASWDAAHRHLRSADRWIFVGYSFPEADFAFKQLLKSAQLASADNPKDIFVIVKEKNSDCDAVKRYQRFFGINRIKAFTKGLEDWVSEFLA